MHYYEHHIGDYAAATAHLSLVEDAIYSRMLRRYYLTEAPLPVSVETVARLIGARDDEAIVKTVLLEFFTLADDGWHQKRCDEDIEHFRVKAQKARESAQARWNAANVKDGCERNANAMRDTSETHNGRNAIQAPVPSPQLKASLQPGDGCPHADIVALYHEALPANPRIKTWTGKRQSNLRARWREDAKRQSLDYWRRFFAHVSASPFLTGQRTGQDGRAFLPGLDWLVMPENFAKVIEGRYHDKGAQS